MTKTQKTILWILFMITASLWMTLILAIKFHKNDPEIMNYKPIDFEELDQKMNKKSK